MFGSREYYFSEENLAKDVYLRRQMDEEGYVPISLIASFRRIKNMNVDLEQILAAVSHSSVLEVKKDSFVRPHDSPTKWIILPGAVVDAVPPVDGSKRGSAAGDSLSLNPDVPEFVPKFGVNGIVNSGGKQFNSFREENVCFCYAENASFIFQRVLTNPIGDLVSAVVDVTSLEDPAILVLSQRTWRLSSMKILTGLGTSDPLRRVTLRKFV